MDNTLVIVLLAILCVALWWYWMSTRKHDKTVQQVAQCEQPLKLVQTSQPEQALTVLPVDQILNQTDISQIGKQITQYLETTIANNILYPSSESEEQQNNSQAYSVYMIFANALIAKYGAKLNNFKIISQKQEQQLPINFAKPSALPTNVSNYLWTIVWTLSNGPELGSSVNGEAPAITSEQKSEFSGCLRNLMVSLRPQIQMTPANTIHFTNAEAQGTFRSGLNGCMTNTGIASINTKLMINAIVPLINSGMAITQ